MSEISVLVLTRNQEQRLPECLETIVEWCDDIHVFDSSSTDRTVAFAQLVGAKVTSRRFDDWPARREWGLRDINFKHDWVLCVNADERVSSALAAEILRAVRSAGDVVAFQIGRRAYVRKSWSRRMPHCRNPVRLFKPQYVHYEHLLQPATHVNGRIAYLTEYLDPHHSSNRAKHWFSPSTWFDREERAIEPPGH
ncbi:glycosyltransferase [Paraburkholderia bryophila]|uniref:glycosyltransferase n=1 Tax=Burkholderiaceae TaxID=119060 RepID=UPI0009DD039E|nr:MULTISPECIES: glycosyltransferase [Burkholderiaceae]